MNFRASLVNGLIDFLFKVLFRVDDRELKKIPLEGPAILVSNHTTNWEAPLYYVRLRPRFTIGLGKKELWNWAPTRVVMKTWKAIPVRRGTMDRGAMDSCFEILSQKKILCLAPEGHRSKTGRLIQAQAGATFFATTKRVPVYPVVQWGFTNIGKNMRDFKRTPVTIKVGSPFYIEKKDGGRITSEDRQKMADEMMYQLALLLPEEYRGHYSDTSQMTTDFLTFL